MIETPEQFRDRIGYLSFRKWLDRRDTTFLRNLWNEDDAEKTRYVRTAEAVYAQALRDLHKMTFLETGEWLIGWNDIKAFAANRGIDLSE